MQKRKQSELCKHHLMFFSVWMLSFSNFFISMWFTNLHLIDVGGVVPPATERSDCFTAAVRDHSVFCLCWQNVHTLHPVLVVVAAAALELERQKMRAESLMIFTLREKYSSSWKQNSLSNSWSSRRYFNHTKCSELRIYCRTEWFNRKIIFWSEDQY